MCVAAVVVCVCVAVVVYMAVIGTWFGARVGSRRPLRRRRCAPSSSAFSLENRPAHPSLSPPPPKPSFRLGCVTGALGSLGCSISTTIRQADALFGRLMHLNPNVVSVMHRYAQFLEEVRSAPREASAGALGVTM
jgi:hypothetical protein